MNPTISIVVAIDNNLGIGKDNRIPWDMPNDRKRFKDITMGHPVIMGRKTFESILSYIKKPFPGRTNIVVTRDTNYHVEGAITAHSLDEALQIAKDHDQEEIIIGGGSDLFKQALPVVNRLYLTIVDGTFSADTFFPDYSDFTKTVHEETGEANGFKYKYVILEK
jgi:dihydrofolate reductase